jgi:hypothetical protein
MFMSVAPLMDHRSVEDCPGWMLDGSAVKLLITGADAVGGGAISRAGGGGGGGGGAFFEHPTANISSVDSSSANNSNAPGLEACNLELSLILRISSFLDLFFIIVSPYSKQVFHYCLAL